MFEGAAVPEMNYYYHFARPDCLLTGVCFSILSRISRMAS
jgi:hypothetical protein